MFKKINQSIRENRFGQREKDSVRQQKIIDILKPKKFWRYNSEDKQFKSIS